MTLAQARKRFPLVPIEIIEWALANIDSPRDAERALYRLEQTRRIQVRYAAA
jgi:hypothetical protein